MNRLVGIQPGAWAAVILPVLVCCTYWNSLRAPLIFDDTSAILENASIRSLWPPWLPLDPPRDGSGVAGRPIVNLSLALNFAMDGLSPTPYHATNMAIHAMAVLVLFSIVRRTLHLRQLHGQFAPNATLLAFAIAGSWAVHPLQTESVTCVVQRTELLVGLFYLLALHLLIRSASEPHRTRWGIAAVASCLLGMASKEVMVTAPFVLLIYDRIFLAGNWRELWRRRRALHLALVATLFLSAILVIGLGGSRGSAAGFGLGTPWWAYTLKQAEAIVRYLSLSMWPNPLVLFYTPTVVYDPTEVLPQLFLILLLIAGTVVALQRFPSVGFLGVWFFVILAPSSSVLPLVSQTMSEHRMYLPLAGALALGWVGVYQVVGRRIAGVLCLVLAALTVISHRRNNDYASELRIWQDTVAKQPGNPLAHLNLGAALQQAGRNADAWVAYLAALRIDPGQAEAMLNLASILLEHRQASEAAKVAQNAVTLRPGSPAARVILGRALIETGRYDEAAHHVRKALQLNPNHAESHDAIASILLAKGESESAIAHLRTAIRFNPNLASAHNNLGLALQSSHPSLAQQHFETALRLKPDQPEPHNNLANTLRAIGRLEAAAAHYSKALRIWPGYADCRFNLGTLLLLSDRPADALVEFDNVLRLTPNFHKAAQLHGSRGEALGRLKRASEALDAFKLAVDLAPDDAVLRFNYANGLLATGRIEDAVAEYKRSLHLNWQLAETHLNLGNALLRLNRPHEAVDSYENALRVRPGYPAAADNLARVNAAIAQAKLRR